MHVSIVNDDFFWLEETLQGHVAAFGHLVQRYQERLGNAMLQAGACSRSDVEEVVQEAFLQAFRKLRSFRGCSSFYTWLYRIAYNVAAELRRQRVWVAVEDLAVPLARDLVDPRPGPVQQLENREYWDMVWRAINALNGEHREVLLLRGVQGCNYRAIAEILGLSPGTVRSRLHRARVRLLEQLNGCKKGHSRGSNGDVAIAPIAALG